MPRLPARSSRARVPGTHAGGFTNRAKGRRQEAPLTQPGRDGGARAQPEFLKRRRCSPRPPPSRGRLPTERPHSLSRGRWTPCLFVWSQRPRRGAAPSSSSAPGPTPPPPARPALPTCLPPTNHYCGRTSRGTRAGEHGTRDLGGAGPPAACVMLRRRLLCGGTSLRRTIL